MSTKIKLSKRCKVAAGTLIRLNNNWDDSITSIQSKRDLYFDSNDGQFLSLEYENWIRYQYNKPQKYFGALIYSIDFQLNDLKEDDV
jgi:hypothetical protein